MVRRQRVRSVEGRVPRRRDFREPGQVREEAALSDDHRVSRGSPTGAAEPKSPGLRSFDGGVHTPGGGCPKGSQGRAVPTKRTEPDNLDHVETPRWPTPSHQQSPRRFKPPQLRDCATANHRPNRGCDLTSGRDRGGPPRLPQTSPYTWRLSCRRRSSRPRWWPGHRRGTPPMLADAGFPDTGSAS